MAHTHQKTHRFTDANQNTSLTISLWETEDHHKQREASGIQKQVLDKVKHLMDGSYIPDTYEVSLQE